MLLAIAGALGAAAHDEEEKDEQGHAAAHHAADQGLLAEECPDLDAHRVDLTPVLVFEVDDVVCSVGVLQIKIIIIKRLYVSKKTLL